MIQDSQPWLRPILCVREEYSQPKVGPRLTPVHCQWIVKWQHCPWLPELFLPANDYRGLARFLSSHLFFVSPAWMGSVKMNIKFRLGKPFWCPFHHDFLGAHWIDVAMKSQWVLPRQSDRKAIVTPGISKGPFKEHQFWINLSPNNTFWL